MAGYFLALLSAVRKHPRSLEPAQSCVSQLSSFVGRGSLSLVRHRSCVWYLWHFCLNSSDSVEARQGEDWKWAGWWVRTVNPNQILYHFPKLLTSLRPYSSPGAAKIQVSGIMMYLAFCQVEQLVWCGSNSILLHSFASHRLPFSYFSQALRAEYGILYSWRSWPWQ